MSESKFDPGTVVKHVHPSFAKIKLYVVKKLEGGSYKCRYLQGDLFISDEFEAEELEESVEKIKRPRTVLQE